MIETVPSFTVLVYEMRTTKQSQVFRNCGPRDGKRLGNLTGRLTSFSEQVQDGAPRGISQGAEGRFRGICNRLVPHNA